MHAVGVISDTEAAKGSVPGLERAIPKTKGPEVASLLHQLGVELHRSPYGPTIRKLLLEIDSGCKERLPKRPSKKAEPEPVEAAAEVAATPTPEPKKPTAKKKTAARAAESAPVKKVVKKKVASPKESTAKKAAPRKRRPPIAW